MKVYCAWCMKEGRLTLVSEKPDCDSKGDSSRMVASAPGTKPNSWRRREISRKVVIRVKMRGFIKNGPNEKPQQPPKSTARPCGYHMSRKRRLGKGLIVGVKTIRGGRGKK